MTMRIGISTITIQAPSRNFVLAWMTVTTAVASAPRPLMAACIHHRGPRSRIQRRTMPDCESVNDRKTPTA